MSVSLYDVSVPPLKFALGNLSTLLEKAAAYAAEKKVDPAVLADARIIADMFPLKRQVQIACDTAKGAAARLAGVDIPKHEDTETTIEQLKQRIAKTIAFLDSVRRAQIDGGEGREIVLSFPSATLKFSGLEYVTKFVLPNFYFHITTAYAILRKNGANIGKSDYLGNVQ